MRSNKLELLAILSGDDDADILLARLKVGHSWLLLQHGLWQSGDPNAANDAEFSRVWNGWWTLDARLRVNHGFQGCIFGSDESCPEGFPCQGCADAPAPAVGAQLALAGSG